MFEEIRQPHQLKHVTMNDRSAPIIPRDAHVGMPKTEALLDAGKSVLSTAKQAALHPISTAKQVAYNIGEKTQQVAEKMGLATTTDRKEWNSLVSTKELVLAKSQLKQTQTDDRSKPVIDKDAHILKNHHKALFAEIQQHRELKHVESTRDSSAPIIDKDVRIQKNRHRDLFGEIKQQHNLKHVSITHDASAPFIDRNIRIKQAPQKKSISCGKRKIDCSPQYR
jgi:hypothetical protein